MDELSDCERKLQKFCNVCGEYTFKQYRCQITALDNETYTAYFGRAMKRNVKWSPNIICKVCKNALNNWHNKKRNSMPFAIPMEWFDPIDHQEDNCYACKNYHVEGINKFKRKKYDYVGVASAILPFPHNEEFPVPNHPQEYSPTHETFESLPSAVQQTIDPNYVPESKFNAPQLVTQEHLDRIVRKLHLSQTFAELLARELKSVDVLARGVKVTGYRHRQDQFLPHFTLSEDKTYAYCNNIGNLMVEMGIDNYVAREWRIFIDSSKSAMKVVLLYQDSTIKPVPILYSLSRKEDHASMKWILETVGYTNHMWRASCDLKVVTLLAGLQTGYTKYCCAFCKFDSRYKGNQYEKRDWESRTSHTSNEFNVIAEQLIPLENILMPPLHIKLGIVKNFVKRLLRVNQEAFEYLKNEVFPGLSNAKIKEGKNSNYIM